MNSKRSLDKPFAVLTSTAASRPVKYYSGVKLKRKKKEKYFQEMLASDIPSVVIIAGSRKQKERKIQSK